MLWNELDYDLQSKVIDKIVDLIRDEDDNEVVDGIMSAVHELEVWSNSPCIIMDEDKGFVAEAIDPFSENGWGS
jgi:hypothetical protein